MRHRAMRLNSATRIIWRIHRWLYRASRGLIGSTFFGRRVVLLRTRGRKSGVWREVALYSFGRHGQEVVVASYVGQPRHPAWYLNLQSDPRVEIMERGRWVKMRSRDSRDEERGRLWEKITRADRAYQEYQGRTTREIPVVVIEPDPTGRRRG